MSNFFLAIAVGISAFVLPCTFSQDWKESMLWGKPFIGKKKAISDYRKILLNDKMDAHEKTYYTLYYASRLGLETPMPGRNWVDVKNWISDTRVAISGLIDCKLPLRHTMKLLPAFLSPDYDPGSWTYDNGMTDLR